MKLLAFLIQVNKENEMEITDEMVKSIPEVLYFCENCDSISNWGEPSCWPANEFRWYNNQFSCDYCWSNDIIDPSDPRIGVRANCPTLSDVLVWLKNAKGAVDWRPGTAIPDSVYLCGTGDQCHCFRAEDLLWFNEQSSPLLFVNVKRALQNGYFCESCIELFYEEYTEDQWEKAVHEFNPITLDQVLDSMGENNG